MSLWTNLRSALNLAARVEELLQQVEQLRRDVRETQSEWGDVLDKLRAREERERKRSKAAVAQALGGDVGGDPRAALGGAVGDPKAEVRRRAASLITLKRQG